MGTKKQTPAQIKAEYQARLDALQQNNERLAKENASLDNELKSQSGAALKNLIEGAMMGKTKEPKPTLFQQLAQDWADKNGNLSRLTERLEAFTERTVGEGSVHKTAKIKSIHSFNEAAEQNLNAMHTSLLRFEELIELLEQIG